MCAVAIPLIAAGVGAAASIYSAKQAADDASAARAQTERQMEQARKTAAQAPQASETSADVTAAVQANRRRAANAFNMERTDTGAGAAYTLAPGNKSKLGM